MMGKRLQYLENEFNSYHDSLHEVSSYLFDISLGMSDEIDNDEKRYAEYWTHEYLYRMYNVLCVYFETLGLNQYLSDFKKKYEPIITDQKKSVEISCEPLKYGDTAENLDLVIEWKKYLVPFNFFWTEKKKEEKKRLIDFLECTNEILKITKTEVYIEEDINSTIRETAKFYFSGVTGYSEGYFVHQFRHYKPDVIIKEVESAVEYKLVREDKDIGPKLDELLIDAKRYSGNHNNKYCVAVFCLSSTVKKTKKEIKEDWNNMKFPKNWEIIIISDVIIADTKKRQQK